MSLKKPLLVTALTAMLGLPLLAGCAYDDHDRYGRDDWRRDRWDRRDWDHRDARVAGYRDRDRDGVPDRLEHRDRW